MKFLYQEWDDFCSALRQVDLLSVPACDVLQHGKEEKLLILKHDVETSPQKALRMAMIEQKYGHRGSYYVQAYLMTEKYRPFFQKIQSMGHEVSYHHDVMDETHGNLMAAMEVYEKNCRRFETFGFPVATVCQHGNPVMERNGYTSNRDFFRSEAVQMRWPEHADIMVNFADKAAIDLTYLSDAGMGFQVIFDPINNDRIPSDDKNEPLPEPEDMLRRIKDEAACVIVSTHPHRWEANGIKAQGRKLRFRLVRIAVRFIMKNQVLRRMMARFYKIAKKL